MPTVAVLGLGEAGSLYARAFLAAGHDVVGFDPADIPTPPGVRRQETLAQTVAGATFVLCLTGAKHAETVLRGVVGHLRPDAVVVEMNSAGPELKEHLAAVVAEAGRGVFADVAVVGSVPDHGARTALVVSGPGAPATAEVFVGLGAPVEVLDAPAGAAARRKLLRSVFMKGLGALVVETLAAGEAAGDLEWVRGQIAGQLATGGVSTDRLAAGTVKHAARRSAESLAAAEMLRGLGITPTMTLANADVHQAAARDAHLLEADLFAAYAGLPVANIGDARGRTGMLAGRIHAMWPGATVVGRALPVFCRKGENPGIIEAIAVARPGDVLVVNGEADPDRALMGELLAEKARAAGVLGMIIDGAVRDVDVLQEMAFPVWAIGSSPAGPYKNGPGSVGRPVSVGGVVVTAGDLVAGDGDGVVVVPAAEVHVTLAAAREVQADETRRRQAILDGARTR